MRQLTLVGLVTAIALLFRKRKEAIVRFLGSRPYRLLLSGMHASGSLSYTEQCAGTGPCIIMLRVYDSLQQRRLRRSSQGGGAADVNDAFWRCCLYRHSAA
jgi:hypothetical protein